MRKLGELGGRIRYGAEVRKIEVEPGTGLFGRPVAKGVTLASGETLPASVVVSNADYAYTHLNLIDRRWRTWNPDWRVKNMRQSMSLVVVYFGFEAKRALDLRHHNIILGPRYEDLLTEIFDKKVLSPDFSQYLHLPTLTDPSMAPPGHHAAYTLVPVPHNGSGIDWNQQATPLVDKVLAFLEERGYLPGLREDLRHLSWITPDHFEHELLAHLGNAFGPEPTLTQSAWFRPHNRSQDIDRLYLVGAGAQPGAGTPSVMMSAKMTARLVAEDLRLG